MFVTSVMRVGIVMCFNRSGSVHFRKELHLNI